MIVINFFFCLLLLNIFHKYNCDNKFLKRRTPIWCHRDKECDFDDPKIITKLKQKNIKFCGNYPCTDFQNNNKNIYNNDQNWFEPNFYDNIYLFKSCFLNTCVYGRDFSTSIFCKHIYYEKLCKKRCGSKEYKFFHTMDQSCCQCFKR